jgi:hypothetical protein
MAIEPLRSITTPEEELPKPNLKRRAARPHRRVPRGLGERKLKSQAETP